MPRSRLALAVLAAALLLHSQTSTGQIDIVVQDSSGGVIPKVVITLMGSDTGNVARTVSTNDAGLAELPLLLPGSYDIAITAGGFEKLVRRGIVVHVGDIVTLPLTLTPGSATEQITIVGETPLLEEKSVTLGQVMEEREIVQLPLNGRN